MRRENGVGRDLTPQVKNRPKKVRLMTYLLTGMSAFGLKATFTAMRHSLKSVGFRLLTVKLKHKLNAVAHQRTHQPAAGRGRSTSAHRARFVLELIERYTCNDNNPCTSV